MERPFAARFSFLLSIPVILGAGLVELKDLGGHALASIPVASMAAGLLSAAFFGYIAIKVVLRLVNQGRLSVFLVCVGPGDSHPGDASANRLDIWPELGRISCITGEIYHTDYLPDTGVTR